MKRDSNMDEISIDILKELGNIGTGNAITSLSQMMGMPLAISAPSLRLAQVQEVYSQLAASQKVETGILVEMKGEVTGMFLFLIDENFTKVILDSLLGQSQRDILHLGELERSALSELGNVMCGSYIRALSTMMNVEIDVSIPSLCVDMGGAILSVPLARLMSKSTEILLIENQFQIDESPFVGRILFFPDAPCFNPILTRLGIM